MSEKAKTDAVLQRFRDAFEATGRGGESAAMASLRNEAMASFAALGFPTTRLEEWRYTNVAAIAKTPFEIAPSDGRVSPDQLDSLALPDLGGERLVFVDGRYSAELSERRDDGPLVLGSFAELAQQEGQRASSALAHWGRLAEIKDDAFTALNTALAADGAVVLIPERSVVEAPIQLVFLATGGASARASFPRVLVVAEPGSQAVVVEDHVSLTNAESPAATTLDDTVSEFVVGANASLEVVLLQRGDASASQIARQCAVQARDSRFAIHTFDLGGALVRNDLAIRLEEPGAECSLRGLYLGDRDQVIDNHTLVDHAVPHCDSRELYKGVLGDRSRGVFRGRVVVRPDAQKTNAEQQNKNLLLDSKAEVDTKPQLEIYADDVKCSHGSTIGQLDPEALFFMRSRGLSTPEAQALLTEGFAGEITGALPSGALTDWVQELVAARLRELFNGDEGR